MLKTKSMLCWVVVVLVSCVVGQDAVFAKSRITDEEIVQIRDAQLVIQQKLAEAMNIVTQTRQEFQQYKGALDESAHFNETYRVRADELEEGMRTLQERVLVLSVQLNDILTGKTTTAGAQKAKEEADAYLLGVYAYNADKLVSAKDTLKKFIAQYPKSRWKPNALFFIAETEYRSGDLSGAVSSYQQVVEGFPDNTWARRALYKQGVSFFEMKDYESSKAFFDKVSAIYPKTSEGLLALDYTNKIDAILKAQAESKAMPK